MDIVLTLVSSPDARVLSTERVDTLRRVLAQRDTDSLTPQWLAPDTACDLVLSGGLDGDLGPVLSAWREKAPIDWALLPREGRRKGLLLADMESTIIGQEMIDEIADLTDLGPRIADITRRAMAGELEFAGSLKERVAAFTGLSLDVLAQVAHRMVLNPGARTLVGTMSRSGAHCALVSGGFEYFASQIKVACGFDEVRANRLEFEGEKLTGRVLAPILGPEAKRQALDELVAACNLSARDACAVGDGANDLDMLAAAGLGVAYHAKPKVRAAARFRLDFADLTGLLFFQGYHRDEFILAPA